MTVGFYLFNLAITLGIQRQNTGITEFSDKIIYHEVSAIRMNIYVVGEVVDRGEIGNGISEVESFWRYCFLLFDASNSSILNTTNH